MRRLFTQAASLFLLTVLVTGGLAAPAAEKGKKDSYALLTGTVFTSEGLSLAGVPIAVSRKGDRKPKWHATSDRRGEFSVRLPAGRGTYEVKTESQDHRNDTRTVEFVGEETVNVIFQLSLKEKEGTKE